jgi:hypothetical protein
VRLPSPNPAKIELSANVPPLKSICRKPAKCPTNPRKNP